MKNGQVTDTQGGALPVDMSLLTAASVVFDAVFVPDGKESVGALMDEADAIHFLNEAFKHLKAVAASGAGIDLIMASYIGNKMAKNTNAIDFGVFTSEEKGDWLNGFIKSVPLRFYKREKKDKTPA